MSDSTDTDGRQCQPPAADMLDRRLHLRQMRNALTVAIGRAELVQWRVAIGASSATLAADFAATQAALEDLTRLVAGLEWELDAEPDRRSP